MGCAICQRILGKLSKPHPNTPCPLEKALYCGVCATYGHTPSRCSRKIQCKDVEDSISIQVSYPPRFDSMLEITDRDECIRTALFGNGITPMVCQEKGKKLQKDFLENKRRLLMHLKERGITMVLKTPRKQYE